MRKVQFSNNHFYHICNRGIDRRKIFLDQDDYWRLYKGLYLFNDLNFRSQSGSQITGLSPVRLQGLALERKLLVNILSFSFLPDHFHLFLEQLVEDGVTKFMHSLNTSYAQYFNLKYKRTGRLFEGPFKAILISKESHFEHLPRYIHLNVLDLFYPKWREGEIKDWKKAEKILESYPWSSHNVYLNKPQKLEVVDSSFAKGMFKNPNDYLNFLKDWSKRNFEKIQECSLE